MRFATAVVVGAGTMGQGIAQLLVEAGLSVRLWDASPEALAAGTAAVRSRVRRRVERGELDADAGTVTGRLQPLPALIELADVDLAIEAVPERLELKRTVLAELDACLPDTAVIATNTSGLDVADLARATTRPQRVLGLHFFNPPPAMPLVEVVATPLTAPETVTAACELAVRLGKTPILVQDRPGFVVNRLLFAMIAEALRAVEDGVAPPEDVDRAMCLGASHPIGPLALADFIGLDVCLDILLSLEARLGERYAPPRRLRDLVAGGDLGRKTGRGIFPH